MDWSVVLSKLDKIALNKSGSETDPLQRVYDSSDSVPGPARVTMSVGSSVNYGEVKCSATVSVSCIQTNDYIDIAGEVAFTKAKELCNDAMSVFGVDPLEEV